MTTSISIQFYTYLYLVHPRPPSTWASNIRLTSAYHSSGVFLVLNCPRLFNREIGHPDDCGHPFGALWCPFENHTGRLLSIPDVLLAHPPGNDIA